MGSEWIPTVSLHFRQYQAFYSLTQAFPVRFSSQFTLNRPVPPWFVLFHGGFSWFGHGGWTSQFFDPRRVDKPVLGPTEGRRASFVTHRGWTSQFCDPQRVNKPVSWRIFLKEKGEKTAIIGQFLLSTSKKMAENVFWVFFSGPSLVLMIKSIFCGLVRAVVALVLRSFPMKKPENQKK